MPLVIINRILLNYFLVQFYYRSTCLCFFPRWHRISALLREKRKRWGEHFSNSYFEDWKSPFLHSEHLGTRLVGNVNATNVHLLKPQQEVFVEISSSPCTYIYDMIEEFEEETGGVFGLEFQQKLTEKLANPKCPKIWLREGKYLFFVFWKYQKCIVPPPLLLLLVFFLVSLEWLLKRYCLFIVEMDYVEDTVMMVSKFKEMKLSKETPELKNDEKEDKEKLKSLSTAPSAAKDTCPAQQVK